MKWFKHQADMIEDPKVRRLVRRYQADGYAVYSLIIERIVKGLDEQSPYPALEETAEDIADILRIDVARVEGIVRDAIDMDLLTEEGVRAQVVAHKIYKHIDQGMVSNPSIRNMIAEYKRIAGIPETQISKPHLIESSPVKSQSSSAKTEENRREEIRGERDAAREAHGSHVRLSADEYRRLIEEYGEARIGDYIERVNLYCASKGRTYRDWNATIRNWLKRDEAPKLPPKSTQTEAELNAILDEYWDSPMPAVPVDA